MKLAICFFIVALGGCATRQSAEQPKPIAQAARVYTPAPADPEVDKLVERSMLEDELADRMEEMRDGF
ncbi:MAG TPA: hypothetical protein VKQ30_20590 [Ktedonobacterales bacterium]|nr:hypothetical protein [Ktedonobacterales bacterium]